MSTENMNELLPNTAEDAAYIQLGSDRYSATIIDLSESGYKITVQYDRAVQSEDFDYYNNQHWLFRRDPEGEIKVFFRNKLGNYHKGSARLHVGHRSHYLDPSF
jgi:hypothetical protein